MTENGSKLAVCFFFTAFIVFIDQITKQYAEKNLIYGEGVEIVPGIRMALLHNPGAAFGILSNESGWQVGFLAGVSLLAAIGLVLWIWLQREESFYSLLPLVLVLAGAIGNGIDRVRFGFVIDFISLHYERWSWPTFNVADSVISLGVFLLILNSFSSKSD